MVSVQIPETKAVLLFYAKEPGRRELVIFVLRMRPIKRTKPNIFPPNVVQVPLVCIWQKSAFWLFSKWPCVVGRFFPKVLAVGVYFLWYIIRTEWTVERVNRTRITITMPMLQGWQVLVSPQIPWPRGGYHIVLFRYSQFCVHFEACMMSWTSCIMTAI